MHAMCTHSGAGVADGLPGIVADGAAYDVADVTLKVTDDIAAATASNIADDTVGSVADDLTVAATWLQTPAKLADSSQSSFLPALHLTIDHRAAHDSSRGTSTMQTTTAAKDTACNAAGSVFKRAKNCSSMQRPTEAIIKLGASYTHCTTRGRQQGLVKAGENTGR